jgi:hypothetical protein
MFFFGTNIVLPIFQSLFMFFQIFFQIGTNLDSIQLLFFSYIFKKLITTLGPFSSKPI